MPETVSESSSFPVARNIQKNPMDRHEIRMSQGMPWSLQAQITNKKFSHANLLLSEEAENRNVPNRD